MSEVKRIIPFVRQEEGCFKYELTCNAFEPETFIFLEEWKSQDHLDAHLAAPHMKEYFERVHKWHAGPTEVTIYETISSRTMIL